MSALFSLIASIVGVFLTKLFGYFLSKQQDEDRIETHERASVAEAANETQQVISEIADARSNLPDPPDDVDALAGELRRRKSGSGRNFGNPKQGDAGGAQG